MRLESFPGRLVSLISVYRAGILSLALLAGQSAMALQLQRGPYLQRSAPTEITIRWRTDLPADSRVGYGTNLNSLTLAATNSGSFTNHEVRLTNLLANTTYYYSVGSSTTNLVSGSAYFFVTAPLGPVPTRIWAIGDSGTGDSSAAEMRDAYINYAGARRTDVWLTLGDNAYFGGRDAQYQVAVFDMFRDLLRQTAVWPSIGNDEDQSDFEQVFTLPSNGEAGGISSGNEAYYAFNYGNIHFVALNSPFAEPATNGLMYQWLQRDLSAKTNRWLIAYWHHPPYSRGSHNSDTDPTQTAMRTNFVRLLEEHGVDLVLCGHSHDYERSFLLHGHYGASTTLQPGMILNHGSGREDQDGAYRKLLYGTNANKGAVYVVAGASSRPLPIGTLDHPVMYISFAELGSVVLDVNGNRLDARYLRSDGMIRDYFTLIKEDLPVLRIALSQRDVLLSWPATASNFIAQVTGDLNNPISWQDITNAVMLSPGERSLRLARSGTNQFYRLRQPP
jgi:Calcineurin-like phosphoesterase/Purple acid Phosphatase, N-terminal domain